MEKNTDCICQLLTGKWQPCLSADFDDIICEASLDYFSLTIHILGLLYENMATLSVS